jgi:transposase
MPHCYNEEFKEKLVQEMMSPNGRTVSEIHRNTGISEPTLYSWKNKYRSEREVVPASQSKPENWSGEDKLAVVMRQRL